MESSASRIHTITHATIVQITKKVCFWSFHVTVRFSAEDQAHTHRLRLAVPLTVHQRRPCAEQSRDALPARSPHVRLDRRYRRHLQKCGSQPSLESPQGIDRQHRTIARRRRASHQPLAEMDVHPRDGLFLHEWAHAPAARAVHDHPLQRLGMHILLLSQYLSTNSKNSTTSFKGCPTSPTSALSTSPTSLTPSTATPKNSPCKF